MTHLPLVLIILDGWGHRDEMNSNAIALANKPNWNHFLKTYPHTTIEGSGTAVGLPAAQMGNSEVGHLNIGAGRIVQQELTRIETAITDGEFFTNPVLCQAMADVKANDSALHILGLLSPGGVHSHQDHIYALLELAQKKGLKKVYLHAFLDGRDTPPKSALPSLVSVSEKMRALNCGEIASIIGRYYAMDRDNRWERIEQAYEMLTQGNAPFHFASAESALEAAYQRGESDEFVKASLIHAENSAPVHIADNDVVVFMNYRADRARQLSSSFIAPNFAGFTRKTVPKLANFVSLTFYDKNLPCHVAFPQQIVPNGLGECLAQHNLPQLRIAETEKYAHVTFFFNGGVEQKFAGEDRILVPSPKVATYDLQPEMSARVLTEQLLKEIEAKKYGVIIVNFANADMVGHTGKLNATIKAIETLDDCLGQIVTTVQKVGGEVIITADHGNAEQMSDPATGQAHTAHTSDPVPFVYIGRPATIVENAGALQDIAPTMLRLLNLPIPAEMTGKVLIRIK